ncbi:MAG TPA: hypothetical protein VFK45_09060 [Gammaproteobacteria bacterium]|nr:hypothetical protein [Gammaproteobacteria bacterium]
MNPFEFVLAIIVVVCAGRIIRHYLSVRAAQPPEDSAQRAKLDDLEQRIRTLETIVTDKGYDLKREFDRL